MQGNLMITFNITMKNFIKKTSDHINQTHAFLPVVTLCFIEKKEIPHMRCPIPTPFP